MAAAQPGILAIACVADSSIAIEKEWFRIMTDYLAPLFNRLAEAHPQPLNQFCLAFITYGLASTRPTPLLCERFFQMPGQLQRELREDPAKLGIGHTGLGVNPGGMAALEGVVSALEMFDKLRTAIGIKPFTASQQSPNQPNKRPHLTSHVIHFAAGPPDGSLHPMWNKDPNFDELTWKTIPDEFKKREINYSMILVRQLPRFEEIHTLMPTSENNVTPWFNVAPQHCILLSGFPSKGVKRSTESNIPSPEQKRPRQNSTSKSSPSVPSNTSANTSTNPPNASNLTVNSVPVPATLSAPAAPAPAPATQPVPRPHISFAQLPPDKKKQFLEQYRQIQTEIQQEAEAIRTAPRDGKSPEAVTHMKAELLKKFQLFQRLGGVLQAANQNLKNPTPGLPPSASAPQLQSANNGLSASDPGPSIAAQNSATIPGNNPVSNSTSDPQGLNTLANGITPNKQVAYPPEVMAQINKLIEHQQLQNRPENMNGSIGNVVPSATPPAAPSQNQLPQVTRWQGTLKWTGNDPVTHARREITIAVIGQCSMNASDPQIHTWPKDLHLVPSQDRMVPPLDFQNWVKAHKPALCQFTPIQVPGTDSKMNEMNCRQLIQLLSEKNLYALAAWDLPNGTRNSNNLLLLPFKNNGLIGAAFPSTGIPEMPKSSAPAEGPTQPDTAQLLAQFNKLPPERQLMMRQWILHRQQQQQRNIASSSSGGDLVAPASESGGAPSNAQFPMRMNVSSYGGGGGPAIGMGIGAQAGVGGNAPAGGVPGVSLEMMQSFMQRKMDGSGQPSGGMN